jgi:Fur family transcriptional regulator, ferric uptake regulator
MVSSLDRLKCHLKKTGNSYTRSRAAVFQAIEQNGPVSMHRLCAQLKGSIDRASVYRTVALYEKLGIVQRLQMGWKYKIELSGPYSDHHHHLLCNSCGTVVDYIEKPALSAMLQQIAKEHNFILEDHQLELQGLCGDCKDVV